MIDFQQRRLLDKYGSWVRVQVAFYDFLFETGSQMCAKHFRETTAAAAASGGWADGENLYESTIGALEQRFSTAEEAWAAFCEELA